MNRQKFLSIYLPLIFVLGLIIYFNLKNVSAKKFSLEKFNQLTQTTSLLKDKTDNLCKYQILSEPKVGDQYVKINFWCQNLTQSRSTLSISAIPTNTVEGALKEYARIINFDYQLIAQKQWYCLSNDQEITIKTLSEQIKPASTIDCFENKSLYRHDQKER